MAKFHGNVGFAVQRETSPGIWEEEITTRHYAGDLLRTSRRTQSSEKLNDDILITNEISIVADAYANQNLFAIRWVEFMGAKWTVTSVTVDYPRLTLSIGGLYNGNTN